MEYAETSIGLKDGTAAGKEAVRWFAEKIMELDEELAEIENKLEEKCGEIPHAENVLEIPGIGGKILSGILAEMGDITRFDEVKEIQKLSGLGLVSCSSGKHKGETRISHRGRKRLRYWAEVLAVSGSAVSGIAWRRIQMDPCPLYNESRESTPEDAVADCDCMQALTGDLYDAEDREKV